MTNIGLNTTSRRSAEYIFRVDFPYDLVSLYHSLYTYKMKSSLLLSVIAGAITVRSTVIRRTPSYLRAVKDGDEKPKIVCVGE
jgi:hypothetical protein